MLNTHTKYVAISNTLISDDTLNAAYSHMHSLHHSNVLPSFLGRQEFVRAIVQTVIWRSREFNEIYIYIYMQQELCEYFVYLSDDFMFHLFRWIFMKYECGAGKCVVWWWVMLRRGCFASNEGDSIYVVLCRERKKNTLLASKIEYTIYIETLFGNAFHPYKKRCAASSEAQVLQNAHFYSKPSQVFWLYIETNSVMRKLHIC